MIDAGFNSQKNATPLTGWYNGDFNYDGKIDGSDYTLIDNAFDTQGASLAAQIAAQVRASKAPSRSSEIGTVLSSQRISAADSLAEDAAAPPAGVEAALFADDSSDLFRRVRSIMQ